MSKIKLNELNYENEHGLSVKPLDDDNLFIELPNGTQISLNSKTNAIKFIKLLSKVVTIAEASKIISFNIIDADNSTQHVIKTKSNKSLSLTYDKNGNCIGIAGDDVQLEMDKDTADMIITLG